MRLAVIFFFIAALLSCNDHKINNIRGPVATINSEESNASRDLTDTVNASLNRRNKDIDSYDELKFALLHNEFENIDCELLLKLVNIMSENGLLDAIILKDLEISKLGKSYDNSSNCADVNFMVNLSNYFKLNRSYIEEKEDVTIMSKLNTLANNYIECRTGINGNNKYIDQYYYYFPGDSILHRLVIGIDLLDSVSLIRLPLDIILDDHEGVYDHNYILTKQISIPKDYFFKIEISELDDNLLQFIVSNEYKTSSEWVKIYDKAGGKYIDKKEFVCQYFDLDAVNRLYNITYLQKVEDERDRLLDIIRDSLDIDADELSIYKNALSELVDCKPSIVDAEIYLTKDKALFTHRCGYSDYSYDFHVQFELDKILIAR